MQPGNSFPRPDIFRFPPETSFRFYALAAAVFGGFTFVWSWLYLSLPETRAVAAPRFIACIRAAQASPAEAARQAATAQACLNDFNLRQGLFVLAALGATALLMLAVHLLRPLVVIRRQGLRPLEEIADPEALAPFQAAIRERVVEAGLRRPPRILVRARARTDAFAFGSWFRTYLGLDAGLVGEFLADRPAFDAKLRHELAHLRNRDINKESLTRASWWLFLLITPPVLLYGIQLDPRNLDVLGPQAWRFGLVVAAIYLARNAAIRAREFDADARAYGWDGPGGALRTTLERAAAQADGGHWRPGILRLHPSAAERVRALHNPGSLLRGGTLLLPAVIGLAFGIGEPPGRFILANLTQIHHETALGGTIAACLFLLPLAGWAMVAIWRDAYGAARRGGTDMLVAALGLAAGLGILAGFRLSFMSSVDASTLPGPVLPVVVLTLFFLWVRAGAYWWLSAELGRRRAVALCWLGLAIGAGVLVAGWTWATMLHGLMSGLPLAGNAVGQPTALQIAFFVLGATTLKLSTLLFFALLWGFAALPRWLGLPPAVRPRLLRRRARQVASWVLAFTLILVAVRLYVRLEVDPDLRATDGFKVWFFQLWVLGAAFLQGGLAGWLVLRRPQASLSEACFCALLAGMLMAIAALVINLAFGGGLGGGFVVKVLCGFANAGALAAAPLAALGAGLRFLVAGCRPLPAGQAWTWPAAAGRHAEDPLAVRRGSPLTPA